MTVYSFCQQNSGGFCCGPAQNIIVVDAKSKEHALEIAEKAGLYLDGVLTGHDCECCGDRWYNMPQEFDTVEEAKTTAEKYHYCEDIPAYLVTDGLDRHIHRISDKGRMSDD